METLARVESLPADILLHILKQDNSQAQAILYCRTTVPASVIDYALVALPAFRDHAMIRRCLERRESILPSLRQLAANRMGHILENLPLANALESDLDAIALNQNCGLREMDISAFFANRTIPEDTIRKHWQHVSPESRQGMFRNPNTPSDILDAAVAAGCDGSSLCAIANNRQASLELLARICADPRVSVARTAREAYIRRSDNELFGLE